jgi:dTDP-4-dehydrorhamnose reductase
MRILLIGKGHLGTFLRSAWGESVTDELHWKGDMAGITPDVLGDLRPDAVVNTAGKTDLAWCEANHAECFRCNVQGPISVYRAIKDAWRGPGHLDIPFVHLSSGCVWDGPYCNGRPFLPCDPPTPACFYAWTKAACDAILMDEVGSPLLILRPRQVFSPLPSPRNTLAKLNGYHRLLDTPNSMTSAGTIARTIWTALSALQNREQNQNLATDVWNANHIPGRVMNVYDKGISSPYEVGVLLADAGCREMPERMTKQDLDSWHKPRRVDAVLRDPFFEATFDPLHVRQELERNIAEYAMNIKKEAGK